MRLDAVRSEGELDEDEEGAPPAAENGVLFTNTPEARPQDGPLDIWVTSCTMCHGRDGSARTWAGRRYMVRDLTSARWRKVATPESAAVSIRDGVPGTKMRAFGTKMSAGQLSALAGWIFKLEAERPTQDGKPLEDVQPEQ